MGLESGRAAVGRKITKNRHSGGLVAALLRSSAAMGATFDRRKPTTDAKSIAIRGWVFTVCSSFVSSFMSLPAILAEMR